MVQRKGGVVVQINQVDVINFLEALWKIKAVTLLVTMPTTPLFLYTSFDTVHLPYCMPT